jgi:DNA-binding transcriptional ArsR family regulator
VTGDQTHARLQRIEDDVRRLRERVSVLSAVDGRAAKKQIADTFASDPRMAIIYRGVQAGLTQQKIAEALRERGLSGAQQQQVSKAFAELEDLGFVERTPKGRYVAIEGWEPFGLEKVLKKTLRDARINGLS